MELYSFLYNKVSTLLVRLELAWFPSPYGVIFILTHIKDSSHTSETKHSFRLLTELYSFLHGTKSVNKTDRKIVSVSLRSYIHSYLLVI